MKPGIGRDTKLCMSLSGRPGTFGSRFHNYLYDAMELDFVYKAFTTRDLAAAIGGIRALGVRGCAISMPFKEACIPMLDRLAPSASAIGAVNTIVNDDGHLCGYNTDYTAIVSLLNQHQVSPNTSFILRGSGGMAKAVAAALRDSGFSDGVVVARNSRTGRALANDYGFQWQADLNDRQADLLINVTPIGMAGGAESGDLAFPKTTIENAGLVFDVVAVPSETPLIRAARAALKHVITGAEVIVLQALEQFVLYTGLHPEAGALAKAVEFALA